MALSDTKLPSRAAMFFTLLAVPLITELLVMSFILPAFPNIRPITASLIDASLLTVVVSIALWWFMIRPLHQTAMQEYVSHNLLKAQVVDAIVTIDMKGNVVSFNHSAEDIFGYSPEEIYGRSVESLFRDEFFSAQKLARLNYSDKHARRIHEVVCQTKDGSEVRMEISVSRLSLGGLEHFLLIMRDITARKEAETALRESEKRFRQIFDQSEDAIFFINPRTCGIVDVNTTAERLFGYTRQELLAAGLESPCFADSAMAIRSFLIGISQGGGTYLDKITGRHRDGTEIILAIFCKLVTLQGCELIYSTVRDITQRVRIEEEALQMQSRLIQANKMTSLGLMVSGVAHEINNPNNFIMTNARLLERAWGDAQKILQEYYRANGDFLLGGLPFSEMEQHLPEMLDGITDGTMRIKAIIADLKGFARPGSPDARGPVDINQIVKSAVSILHHEIVNHTNKFNMSLEDGIPLLHGNSQQLAQVIMNLIMNACQSLSSSAAGIWVSTCFNAPEQLIQISVRDEGEGVPTEVGRRILEPFFTTKLDSGGTGLGLSISMSIVREHCGTMDFESIPLKGTTFTVKLPLHCKVSEEST